MCRQTPIVCSLALAFTMAALPNHVMLAGPASHVEGDDAGVSLRQEDKRPSEGLRRKTGDSETGRGDGKRGDSGEGGTGKAGDANELLKPKAPATMPMAALTRPAAKVSPDARALLDQVKAAYAAVGSLRLSGSITADIDVNGVQNHDSATFESLFVAESARFRHTTVEQSAGPHPATRPSTEFGSTGRKLWVYEPRYQYVYLADAPGERVVADKLPKQLMGLMWQLDPSLILAAVPDAAAEITDGVKAVDRLEDVQIQGEACAVLKIDIDSETRTTLAIDLSTHLVRRLTWDRKAYAEQRKQQDVKKVLVTLEYAKTEINPELDDALFAWSQPEGARDVTTLADAGADAGDAPPPDGAAAALVNEPAPDFKLKDSAGNEVKLADLKGNVILLDFWATWCGPCRASLPELDKIYAELGDKGLKAFAINLREEPSAVESFVKESGLKIPVLFDKDGSTSNQYGVSGIPQTVVIDKTGKVVRVTVGSGTQDQIREAVEAALGNSKDAEPATQTTKDDAAVKAGESSVPPEVRPESKGGDGGQKPE